MMRVRLHGRGPDLIGTGAALGLGLGFALALVPGCKASLGEVCRCASDCRDGLVCVVGSSDILADGECGPSDQIGHCVDDDSLSELEGGLGDMPIFDDLPTKRDIGSDDEESGSESESESTETDTTDTTDTGTDTTDTGTTDTTDTGTDTTDTGTDTSDTGTDTGTDTTT